MCDCLPKMLCVYCIYIYIYHVNKFEARLLFLYLPLKNVFGSIEACNVTCRVIQIPIYVQLQYKTCYKTHM